VHPIPEKYRTGVTCFSCLAASRPMSSASSLSDVQVHLRKHPLQFQAPSFFERMIAGACVRELAQPLCSLARPGCKKMSALVSRAMRPCIAPFSQPVALIGLCLFVAVVRAAASAIPTPQPPRNRTGHEPSAPAPAASVVPFAADAGADAAKVAAPWPYTALGRGALDRSALVVTDNAIADLRWRGHCRGQRCGCRRDRVRGFSSPTRLPVTGGGGFVSRA
jgi:hypothetical protein